MALPIKARDVPERLAVGAFVLNSGWEKLRSDEETARNLHGMAVTAYPFLHRVPPVRLTRLLACTEIALGATLLVPTVPTPLAGLGLTGFSAGLVGMYLRLPGTREPGRLAPSPQGVGLAKDAWLLGMGLGFVIDGLSTWGARVRRPLRRPGPR